MKRKRAEPKSQKESQDALKPKRLYRTLSIQTQDRFLESISA